MPLVEDVFRFLADAFSAVNVDPVEDQFRVRSAEGDKGDVPFQQQKHTRIVIFNAGEHETVHAAGIDKLIIGI
ncbi:hypothetical protein SDC9_153351 [bioreactor metagenome]|uniref:Fe/B12 periplasmic-binding domain-containing protein n=1 Tax=bioreactor metagenome TaxID=1076179 RepID=A0A645EXF3_9ZZZZ